eukprot:64831-Chlamydomonas_euryale.AAC.1
MTRPTAVDVALTFASLPLPLTTCACSQAPQHIPPWARAEVIFEREFDEFNAYVAANIDEMVKGSGR